MYRRNTGEWPHIKGENSNDLFFWLHTNLKNFNKFSINSLFFSNPLVYLVFQLSFSLSLSLFICVCLLLLSRLFKHFYWKQTPAPAVNHADKITKTVRLWAAWPKQVHQKTLNCTVELRELQSLTQNLCEFVAMQDPFLITHIFSIH